MLKWRSPFRNPVAQRPDVQLKTTRWRFHQRKAAADQDANHYQRAGPCEILDSEKHWLLTSQDLLPLFELSLAALLCSPVASSARERMSVIKHAIIRIQNEDSCKNDRNGNEPREIQDR